MTNSLESARKSLRNWKKVRVALDGSILQESIQGNSDKQPKQTFTALMQRLFCKTFLK